MKQGVDVTKEVFQYAEIRRFLWNTYFAHKVVSIMDQRVNIFFDLHEALFRSMVLEAREEGLGNCSPDDAQARREHLRLDLDSPASILSNSYRMPNREFDRELMRSSDWQGRYLIFVDFLDWPSQGPLGRCSLRYVEIEPRHEIDERTEERWLVETHAVCGVRFVD